MTEIPRPEHPRPDFQRKTWQNLNGEWEFAIDSARSGLESGWMSNVEFPHRIIVPFCPESKLSGIQKTDFLEAVWYRRKFVIDPPLRGKKLMLNFGAVDYAATVWVNGKEVGRHYGGYTPFQLDVSNVVRPEGENELVVYAVDDIRSGIQPSGKQSHSLHSAGCMYTRTTGIWQTVWLESVSKTHISALAIWPDAENGQVALVVDVRDVIPNLKVEALVLADGQEVVRAGLDSARHRNVLILQIPNVRLWAPGKPFLYELRITLREDERMIDEIESYFGFRDIRIERNRILINDSPVFQRLVLDQGFWPDGIYTATSEAELRADIERSILLGFNGARLHQKVFEPRTLYWADRLGYIVWAEFPDWGCHVRNNPAARENFLREWIEVILRDRNHPSIVTWTPFNETRSSGERYAPNFIRQVREITKHLDPTRPLVDTSGYTHVHTDIWDLHDYEQNPQVFAERYEAFGKTGSPEALPRNDPEHEPAYEGQPVVVSEFGGARWSPDQHNPLSWGYGEDPKDEVEFLERFKGLTGALLANPHIAGFCYTQLTDVEQEMNGLYTYDRKPKFLPDGLRAAVIQPAAIENR